MSLRLLCLLCWLLGVAGCGSDTPRDAGTGAPTPEQIRAMQQALAAYDARKRDVASQRAEVRDLLDIDAVPALGIPRLEALRGRCHNFAAALQLLSTEQEKLEAPLRALTQAAGDPVATEHARTAPERARGMELNRAEQAMFADTCRLVDLLLEHKGDWEARPGAQIAFAEEAQIAAWDSLYARRNRHAERYNALATAAAPGTR